MLDFVWWGPQPLSRMYQIIRIDFQNFKFTFSPLLKGHILLKHPVPRGWCSVSLWIILGSPQWRYHAIQNGGVEVVQFGQCLITHGIVGYIQTIDLLRKSANLVHVLHGDRIKLELNSEPADLVKAPDFLTVSEWNSY